LFVLAMLGTCAARADTIDALNARTPLPVSETAAPDTSNSTLRQRAEDLARAASQRFSEILSTDKPAPQPAAEKPAAEPGAGTFAPVWNWLARSAKDYDDVVIGKLKSPDGWIVVVQRADGTPPSPPSDKPEEPPRQLRGWS